MSVFCLTTLNKNFIKHIMNKNNYYEEVYKEIKDDLTNKDIDINITSDLITKDINNYVKSRYRNDYYQFAVEEYRDDYNRFIKFNNYFGDYDLCLTIYLLFIIDFILVVGTGVLFLRTKTIHNLNFIMVINFLITVVVYGVFSLGFTTNLNILNEVIQEFSRYYLGTSIILLELVIFNLLKKTRLKK